MILHDVCDVRLDLTDDEFGDPIGVTVEGVPCEMTPIDSIEASRDGSVTTRYTFFTDVDLGALATEHAAPAVFIHYPSGSPNALGFEAGFE